MVTTLVQCMKNAVITSIHLSLSRQNEVIYWVDTQICHGVNQRLIIVHHSLVIVFLEIGRFVIRKMEVLVWAEVDHLVGLFKEILQLGHLDIVIHSAILPW